MLLAGAARAEPVPFRIAYELTRDGDEIAEVTRTLEESAEGRWRFTSRVEPSGILASVVGGAIEEVTELERAGDRLRPLHYRFRRHGLGREREVTVRFDWQRGRVVNEVNGNRWTMTVPEATLDKHALVLAVVEDLRAGRVAGEYPVADGGRLKTYVHEHLGEERVITPLGAFDALTLRRMRPGDQPPTLFWHAPGLDYVPVRIERRDGEGRLLRMSLTRYRPGSVTGPAPSQ